MIIKSQETQVAAKREAIYAFLQDAQNYYHMMHHDKINDWQAKETECSFKVQGGFVITLILDGGIEPSNVYLKSGGKSPFSFKLDIQLSDMGESTNGVIVFDGEVNMFMKMMVEKPLTALFNVMSQNLKKHFEETAEV